MIFRKKPKCFYFCSRYFPKRNFRNENKLKKCKQQNWCNQICQKIWKNLNWLGHVLKKNPNNHFFRGQYFNLKRRYRARCQKKTRKFERKLLQNLENLYSYNDEEVWNLFKQIKGNSSNKLPKYQTLTSLK